MEKRGSGAAGGGLPLEERRDRAADPACADASHAGAGPGPDGSGCKPGVRGCVACRHRPGPSKSREEHQPWASPITSRTTAGRAEDRRGGGNIHGSTGRNDPPLNPVCDTDEMKDKTREWVVIYQCWPGHTESGLPRQCVGSVWTGRIAVWSIRGRQGPQ